MENLKLRILHPVQQHIHAGEVVSCDDAFLPENLADTASALPHALDRVTVTAAAVTTSGHGHWSFSTISGNWKRGTGILNNELYIGRLIWNRQRFVKDPATGKRQARPNPPEDWVIEGVEDLRIIEDELWHRVKDRQGAIRAEMNPAGVQNGRLRPERAKRPTYLFSGLLVCDCWRS
jgi:site-specific DNA recombinase